MKIILTGGGTLGPVTPLLALVNAWKQKDAATEFVWIGTPHGPERDVVLSQEIEFYALPVARLPRYVSIEWILLPVKFFAAFVKAFMILRKERPDIIASAGGYTAVPVIYAGWLLGIHAWVHEQDTKPLLTNILTAPLAHWVTTAWERTMGAFPSEITKCVGNPARQSLLEGSKESAVKRFGLKEDLPTVLIFGGGGGASWMNHGMLEIGSDLAKKANVLHLTGKGKMLEPLRTLHENYHAYELLKEEMADALAVADVVVTRAGMGTITELSALGKASILIPLPNSPQEINAKIVEDAGATIILHQEKSDAEQFKQTILDLLGDDQKRHDLSEKMKGLLPTDITDQLIEMLKK